MSYKVVGYTPSNGHRHLFSPHLHLFVYVRTFSKSSPSSNLEKSRHIVNHSYFNKYTIRLVEAYFSGSNPCNKKTKQSYANKSYFNRRHETWTPRSHGHIIKKTHTGLQADIARPLQYILNSIRIFPCCNPFF